MPSRVFILGAGFSKAAKMPDAVELARSLVDLPLIQEDDELRQWMDGLKTRVEFLMRLSSAGTAQQFNVEQFFDFMFYDLERTLLQQYYDRTNYAHRIDKGMNHVRMLLDRELPVILIDRQLSVEVQEALPCLEPFARELAAGDTVLTFNYDTLLEGQLDALRRSWWHGFKSEVRGDVTVLKLHGSLDWWHVAHNETQSLRILYEPMQLTDSGIAAQDPEFRDLVAKFVLARVSDLGASRELLDRHNPFWDWSKRPALAPLGPHKPLRRLLGSATVWHKAFEALVEADEIYVIGWSASPYDTMARFHFASEIARRSKPPKRVVVVNPCLGEEHEDHHIHSKNFKSVFGEFKAKPECVEKVDWPDLLAGGNG